MRQRLTTVEKKKLHNDLCRQYQQTKAWKDYFREYMRNYYSTRPEQKKKHKQLMANWRKANRKRHNKYCRDYYRNHIDEMRKKNNARSKEYRDNNKELIAKKASKRYAEKKKGFTESSTISC